MRPCLNLTNYGVLAKGLRTGDISKTRHLERLRSESNFIVHQGRSKLRHEGLETVYLNAEEVFREFYRGFPEQINEGYNYYEIIDEAKQYK